MRDDERSVEQTCEARRSHRARSVVRAVTLGGCSRVSPIGPPPETGDCAGVAIAAGEADGAVVETASSTAGADSFLRSATIASAAIATIAIAALRVAFIRRAYETSNLRGKLDSTSVKAPAG